MAYVRALSELKVTAKIVFFRPDPMFSKVEESFPYIEFVYLWDNYYINLPIINKLYLRYYMSAFVRGLQPGDVVYNYGFPDLLVALSARTDIRVIEERTEHNEVHFRGHIKKVDIDSFLLACRHVAGVVVISQGLRQYYIENGCNPEKVHIVNMIVDSTRFKGLQKSEANYSIAYCGSATNNKDGVNQLIKAFALVVKKYPNCKLLIIGKTPSSKERFNNLELVKMLGVENNIVFKGEVPAFDIPQLLMDADMLALDRPANIQAMYGFPTKLGEYLLTGNPVVLTRVGDIPRFLKDGESALIAEPDNPEEFASKICWVIEHPLEARWIGNNGKRVAEQHFNYLEETEKIIHIINSLDS
jgi:glycosyltransferase involved in cell wall biosynthesis